MIVFVYLENKQFAIQLRENFKGYTIINANLKFKKIKKCIKPNGKYVLVNFYKSQYQFEYITTLSKILFLYFAGDNANVSNLPKYIQKYVILISKDFEQNTSNYLKNPPKITIQCHYIWNTTLSIIKKNSELHKDKQLNFDFKPIKKSSDDVFWYNTGRMCYLMMFPNFDFLVLYDKKGDILYKILDSNVEGTKQFFLKELVFACENIIVGSVNFYKNILTFTFIGTQKSSSFSMKNYLSFFASSMKKLDQESKKIKMCVKETPFYYCQEYNNFHLYVPKVVSIYCLQNKKPENFNNIIFL